MESKDKTESVKALDTPYLISRFDVDLTDEQAAHFASLRRRTRDETPSKAVVKLIEMVYDRLDRGYWRYLAITALTERYVSHREWRTKWIAEHPDDHRFDDDSESETDFFKRLFDLSASKAVLQRPVKELFDEWADAWDKETMHMSFGHDKHWAFFAIMSLGDEGIPLVLARYAEDIHIKWHIVLTMLVGDNPTEEENRKQVVPGFIGFDVRGIHKNWMSWAKRRGFLSSKSNGHVKR